MRGVKTNRTASVVIRRRAYVHYVRRGYDEIGTEASLKDRRAPAFDELMRAV
jgi:hypothetical protein